MKSVLISINPKWCELIFEGKKTIEVRKTRPKLETPFKVYIYCTKKKDFILDGEPDWGGKVIGEFVCDRMFDFIQAGAGIMFAQGDNQLNPRIALILSCLSDKEIDDYLGDKDGYGWHISDLVIYDKPKCLSEFKTLCKYSFGCDECPEFDYFSAKNTCRGRQITRAPQSWMYAEEVR